MTFEDFFTLTELKDGLATPARVNELLTVMQKENECVVKNVGEATRQWSAVASTIATTENNECLDLFIQLDGLCFIDSWLKDAQKFGNDTGDSFLEELIIVLLRALERLHIDHHRSLSSGIGRTVQNLLGHSSSVIRDRAKALCDKWLPVQDIGAAATDLRKIDALSDGPECPSPPISPCRNDGGENLEESRDQKMLSVCSDTVQQARDKEDTSTKETIMESATANKDPLDTVDSSSISAGVSGNLLFKVGTDKSKPESTVLTGISGATPTVLGSTCEEQSDVSQLDKDVEEAKEKQEINSLDKAGAVELTTLSSLLDREALPSSADVENALESAIKTEMREDTSDKVEDMVDGGASPDHCHSTMAFNTRSVVGDSSAVDLQVSPGDESKWGEAENPKTMSKPESDDGAEDAKKHVGIRIEFSSGNDSRRFKRQMKAQDSDLMNKRPSDMELDYGMVDPLELARQVAIEVEREVDSRERSCSTSQNMSGGGIERPDSPDSTNEKEHQSIDGSGKEVSSGPGACPKDSPSGPEPANDVETLVSKMASCKPDIPDTQIYEVAQESVPDAERGFSGFDLNQEVTSEETDCPVDPGLTPISVVSASRAVAADGLPAAPLQFKGTLGWKGSAATSAFRRIPEVEKTCSSSGSRNNSKHRLDHLDFDLNVAEGVEAKIEDFLSRNEMLTSSCLPSGEEPSAEASPRRLERLQLDLNSLGDGDAGAVAFDWKRDGRVASLKQNGPQSPSRSSSSSSIQPSFRNIDLNMNDHSTIPTNASLDNPFLGKLFNNSNASGGVYKREESVISIFGTQVEVKRKDSVPQPNGRISDPAVDFSLGRTGSGLGLGSSMHYANLPAYGHNGFTLGPAMSFSSPTYGPSVGPIPYMVDSRGAAIVPQIVGSSSAVPPAFSQPPQPFIFNVAATGTSSGSNGAGPSRHSFDLNSGFMTEGGNRENNGGLRQFFNHNQGRSVDEQYMRMNNTLQASSSSVPEGKRQEPDSGWEPFPINYKHQQPPWR